VLFLIENSLAKSNWEMVRCRDATASSIVSKFQGEVLPHFHAVFVKRHSRMRDSLLVLPERILCEQSPLCKRKLWACLRHCPSLVTLF
jgi:hypothetical protein